ncbi:hypothetical protein TNCV_4256271 [Trichonephila clavipes]|nr:hypothetical protein TNCV_4256271 [Trichonephila clavipes]
MYFFTREDSRPSGIMPWRPGGTVNSRRPASPLMLGDERWELLSLQGVLPQNWGGTELDCLPNGAQDYG